MNARTEDFGPLISAEFSNSGNSLGNMYRIETAEGENGELIVIEYNSPIHSDPAIIREYSVDADLLDRITQIVDDSGMKTWGDVPMSELFPLDASTPRIELVFENTADEHGLPIRLSYTAYQEFPEGGMDTFNDIRHELEGCIVEENLIREYMEQRR